MPDQEKATAGTTQADAGTGTTQADVAAAARAAAAAAQTAATQAAAASDNAQAAASSFSQTEQVPDISQAEAYMVNLKRLVENALSLDAQLNQIITTTAQRLASNNLNFDEQVKNLSLNALVLGQTALKDAVGLSNRVNNQAITDDVRANDNAGTQDKSLDSIDKSERERTVRGGDSGDVIRWSVLAKNPVEMDAIAAAMVAAVDRVMLAKKTTA